MWPRRPLRAAVVLVALTVLAVPVTGVAAVPPSPAAASPALHADGGPDRSASLQQPAVSQPPARAPAATLTQDTPPTTIHVNLTESGDARWTVRSRFALNGSTDRAAFRAMVDDLSSGTTAPPVGYSPATFRRFADRVATVTNRSMAVTDTRWNGTVRNDTGVLSLSFTWTNFARTDGDRVVLGDVFAADVGWFDSLTDDQVLFIAPPPNYAVVTTGGTFPVGDQGVIRVDGPGDLPADVSTENVSVVYAPTAAPPTSEPPGGLPAEFVGGGALLVVLAVLGGAYVLFGRDPDDPAPRGGADEGDTGAGAATGDTPDAGGDSPTSPDTTAPSSTGSGSDEGTPGPGPAPDAEPAPGGDPATAEAEADADAGAAGTAAGAGAGAADGTTAGDDGAGAVGGTAPDEPVDEELLSDEERVERLLSENGGRMKQATIVTETGWSNAKVSQLLSAMHDDGRVDKLRIGRENLISLPDESVVDTGDASDTAAGDPDSASASSDPEDS